MKSLIFSLRIFIVTLFMLLAPSFIAPAASLAQASSQNFAQDVLALVNIERSKVGLSPLFLDYELMEGCQIRAQELPQAYSHTRPDGRPCFSVIGYHNTYKGENIAAGYANSQEAVEGWMNSPGHRDNILNRNYVKLGVGYYYDPNSPYKHYWVQMFMGRDIGLINQPPYRR